MPYVSIAYRGIALAAVLSLSASGQQAVSQSTPAVAALPVTLDLPVEPARTLPSQTLAGAAALNDFPQFDQLYRTALERGEAPVAFAELHRFWTWSLTDPLGAFYGRSTYDRLAAIYPAYAAYIEAYELVDNRGQIFYPSAETRRFLLSQAIAGVVPDERPVRLAAVAPKVKSAAVVDTARPAVVPKAAPAPVPVAVVKAAPTARPAVEAAQAMPLPRGIPTSHDAAGEASHEQDHRLGQVLLLTILGLLSVGVVTLVLHTPPEEPTSRGSAA